MKSTFVLGSLLALLSTSALAECAQQEGYNGGADVLPACDAQQQEQTTMGDDVQKSDPVNNSEQRQRIDLATTDTDRRYDCLGYPTE